MRIGKSRTEGCAGDDGRLCMERGQGQTAQQERGQGRSAENRRLLCMVLRYAVAHEYNQRTTGMRFVSGPDFSPAKKAGA